MAKPLKLTKEEEARFRIPCYYQTGYLPVNQDYQLTQLKLSNVRWNDEIVPAPQRADVTARQVRAPYPIQHKHASHEPVKEVFPSFTRQPPEGESDIRYRQMTQLHLPIHQEMPAGPNELHVIRKAREFGNRQELQVLRPRSLERALTWNAGDYFTQQWPRSAQQVYPIPPKLLVPNDFTNELPARLQHQGVDPECEPAPPPEPRPEPVLPGQGIPTGIVFPFFPSTSYPVPPRTARDTSLGRTPRSVLVHDSHVGNIIPQPPYPDLSLSERTTNATLNLERSQWLSSYQSHFCGQAHASPIDPYAPREVAGSVPPLALDNYDQKNENIPALDNTMTARMDYSFRSTLPFEGRRSPSYFSIAQTIEDQARFQHTTHSGDWAPTQRAEAGNVAGASVALKEASAVCTCGLEQGKLLAPTSECPLHGRPKSQASVLTDAEGVISVQQDVQRVNAEELDYVSDPLSNAFSGYLTYRQQTELQQEFKLPEEPIIAEKGEVLRNESPQFAPSEGQGYGAGYSTSRLNSATGISANTSAAANSGNNGYATSRVPTQKEVTGKIGNPNEAQFAGAQLQKEKRPELQMGLCEMVGRDLQLLRVKQRWEQKEVGEHPPSLLSYDQEVKYKQNLEKSVYGQASTAAHMGVGQIPPGNPATGPTLLPKARTIDFSMSWPYANRFNTSSIMPFKDSYTSTTVGLPGSSVPSSGPYAPLDGLPDDGQVMLNSFREWKAESQLSPPYVPPLTSRIEGLERSKTGLKIGVDLADIRALTHRGTTGSPKQDSEVKLPQLPRSLTMSATQVQNGPMANGLNRGSFTTREYTEANENLAPTRSLTARPQVETNYVHNSPARRMLYARSMQDTGERVDGVYLLKLQNNFSKSDARKAFHSQFPEVAPDLRENTYRDKRHFHFRETLMPTKTELKRMNTIA